jgi:hypothetical protein
LCSAHPQHPLCSGDGFRVSNSVLGRAGPKRPLGRTTGWGRTSGASQIPLGGPLEDATEDALMTVPIGKIFQPDIQMDVCLTMWQCFFPICLDDFYSTEHVLPSHTIHLALATHLIAPRDGAPPWHKPTWTSPCRVQISMFFYASIYTINVFFSSIYINYCYDICTKGLVFYFCPESLKSQDCVPFDLLVVLSFFPISELLLSFALSLVRNSYKSSNCYSLWLLYPDW